MAMKSKSNPGQRYGERASGEKLWLKVLRPEEGLGLLLHPGPVGAWLCSLCPKWGPKQSGLSLAWGIQRLGWYRGSCGDG